MMEDLGRAPLFKKKTTLPKNLARCIQRERGAVQLLQVARSLKVNYEGMMGDGRMMMMMNDEED